MPLQQYNSCYSSSGCTFYACAHTHRIKKKRICMQPIFILTQVYTYMSRNGNNPTDEQQNKIVQQSHIWNVSVVSHVEQCIAVMLYNIGCRLYHSKGLVSYLIQRRSPNRLWLRVVCCIYVKKFFTTFLFFFAKKTK